MKLTVKDLWEYRVPWTSFGVEIKTPGNQDCVECH